VFDLEIEGHAVGILRQNLAPKKRNHQGTTWRRNNSHKLLHKCHGWTDRQTDRCTTTRTAVCI